jgi:hypothetical protein
MYSQWDIQWWLTRLLKDLGSYKQTQTFVKMLVQRDLVQILQLGWILGSISDRIMMYDLLYIIQTLLWRYGHYGVTFSL